MDNMEDLNRIGYDIVGASFEVRKTCGRHLLESFYENALAYELRKRGHKVEQQKVLPAIYKDVEIKDAYVMDLVIDDKVVIELKSLVSLSGVEFKQLNTYLHLSHFKLGYLINFSASDFVACAWKGMSDRNKGIIRIIR